MLDYDLVTSKACYRLPRRDDMPVLLRLAAQSTAERTGRTPDEGSPERILQTVKELSRHPDRGTVFLFERGQDLVGYCILVTHWSNAYGGTVLRIDELFIDRDHRAEGIVEDFLELLARVAPPGTCAIQIDADAKDKWTAALCARAGFLADNARILTRRVQQGSEVGGA
ncbi:MAG TPA: GNAT family N-acetyltransferase [Spirochaetia bacterium]|nr:GNAT family N-acetyltransferase [Spirochaetia bacterium]